MRQSLHELKAQKSSTQYLNSKINSINHPNNDPYHLHH
jgi:hypothetical protein